MTVCVLNISKASESYLLTYLQGDFYGCLLYTATDIPHLAIAYVVALLNLHSSSSEINPNLIGHTQCLQSCSKHAAGLQTSTLFLAAESGVVAESPQK